MGRPVISRSVVQSPGTLAARQVFLSKVLSPKLLMMSRLMPCTAASVFIVKRVNVTGVLKHRVESIYFLNKMMKSSRAQ